MDGFRCYSCGELGHYARDCDQERGISPGPWPPPPPQFRRSEAGPKSDARAWAAKIRREMGWSDAPAEVRQYEGQQEAARRQAEESRRERELAGHQEAAA